MLDVALLAASAVRILVPYIKRGADGLANAIGERAEGGVADFAVDVAKSVWDRVRDTFTASGHEGAVEEFEKNPDDAQEYLEKLLKRRLEEDPDFARELNDLVTKPSPDGPKAEPGTTATWCSNSSRSLNCSLVSPVPAMRGNA